MMKINWSGRSHKYTEKEISILSNVIRNADPLTGGKYLKLFENSLKNFLGKKIFLLHHQQLRQLN